MIQQPIIHLTEAAQSHIKKFLAPMKPNAGFRIGIKKTGCSGYAYLVDVLEAPKENDLVTQQNDIQLFIAKDCVDILKGTTIDFLEKDAGQKQLIFNNPNAEEFCGCGESFTLKKDQENENA